MYINILETEVTMFHLSGYISDSGKEVYIELLGFNYGHLLLMDSIDSLKVLRNEEDPWKRMIHRIPGWYKIDLRLDDITSGKPRVSIYDKTLGKEETKFLEGKANRHILALYQYLQKNPWVRVSYTAPVWDGNAIVNVTIPNDFRYQELHSSNLRDFHEFGNMGLENYRFDDGSPLPWVKRPFMISMPELYELEEEHEGYDKTFVLQPTNRPEEL